MFMRWTREEMAFKLKGGDHSGQKTQGTTWHIVSVWLLGGARVRKEIHRE